MIGRIIAIVEIILFIISFYITKDDSNPSPMSMWAVLNMIVAIVCFFIAAILLIALGIYYNW